MSIRHLISLFATALLLLILMTGCQSAPSASRGVTFGPARSLAMDSPTQLRLNASTSDYAGEAWYLTRNDIRPTIYYGSQVQTYTETQVYERDRQSIQNGRVHDHFSRTTVRRTYSRGSR